MKSKVKIINKIIITLLSIILLINTCPTVFAEDNQGTKSHEIIFIANVDPRIKNDCYVTVENLDTGMRYSTELYKHNNYQNSLTVDDEGKYTIVNGGLVNDNFNKYPAESKDFQVVGNYATYVEFNIGDPDYDDSVEEETTQSLKESTSTTEHIEQGTKIDTNNVTEKDVTKETTTTTSNTNEINNENNENVNQENMTKIAKTIITIIFIVLGLGAIIMIILIKKRNNS